jgi:3-oxo-5-alpha-steroid 4-dehydrogenase 1
LPKTDEELVIALEIIHVIGAVFTFATAIFPGPYGRYADTVKFSGFSIGGQKFWRCFCITWIIPLVVAAFTPNRMLVHPLNKLALLMYISHYIYRSVFYPSLFMKNASSWPIESAITALLACAFNGFIQSFHLLNVHKVDGLGTVGLLGLLMFLTGLSINIYHDMLLANLRKNLGKGQSKYRIPRGGLFEYISAANYFGEIVEWWGLALFTRGFPQIIFGITTIGLIGIRGWQHHQFYKKTFGRAYPPQRKAIIPFLL